MCEENSHSNNATYAKSNKDQKHKQMLKEYLEQIEYKQHQSRIGARGGDTEEYLQQWGVMLKQVHGKLQQLRHECENDPECNHRCYSGRIKNKDLASLNKKLGQFEENFDVKSRLTHLSLIPVRLDNFINDLTQINQDGYLEEAVQQFKSTMEQEIFDVSSQASNNRQS